MNNEEKAYSLLEKIYFELQETKKELKSEIQENRKAMVKLEAKIEDEISDKVRSLYDNRELVNDKLNAIDDKLDNIQIDINNLTIKTAYNDTRIIKLTKESKFKE
ncbi:hypothetical protein CLPU_10c01460 [Gottschalkia purinilytica]|uniref:Uncharacterized protein n=1 Tax=Gottschalkia purinilytica TaxID=1503 RepID=A0A0L0W9H4_GOTPU|nr:hypothetical protein [Gottschalkia purinilytica]KNF08091.1 hypothetical protein CLPU_10c01460 [Gottschalkia purinilytica]